MMRLFTGLSRQKIIDACPSRRIKIVIHITEELNGSQTNNP